MVQYSNKNSNSNSKWYAVVITYISFAVFTYINIKTNYYSDKTIATNDDTSVSPPSPPVNPPPVNNNDNNLFSPMTPNSLSLNLQTSNFGITKKIKDTNNSNSNSLPKPSMPTIHQISPMALNSMSMNGMNMNMNINMNMNMNMDNIINGKNDHDNIKNIGKEKPDLSSMRPLPQMPHIMQQNMMNPMSFPTMINGMPPLPPMPPMPPMSQIRQMPPIPPMPRMPQMVPNNVNGIMPTITTVAPSTPRSPSSSSSSSGTNTKKKRWNKFISK